MTDVTVTTDPTSRPRAGSGGSSSLTEPERRNARRAEFAIASLLFLVGLLIFMWQCGSGIADAMQLALPDSDDVMRLVGVRAFLEGQSWFDTTLYRYLPPAGVTLHWSRLVDLPLAGGILALKPILGADLAERVLVTAWPLLLFAVYSAVLFWGASRLFNPRAGGLAVFIAAQMVVFGDLFAPGRIDHHNIQVILVSLAAIGFGLAQRRAGAALASGIAAALSLAVGLETLPVVAAIGCAFAIAWIAAGDRAARPFLFFAASLAAVAPLILAAQTAPSLWLVPACDALSAPWLLLTSGGGLGAALLVAATPRMLSWRGRLAASLIAGGLTLGAFAFLFPQCLAGPYQVVPEPYRNIWLNGILEAHSFRRFLAVNPSPALQALGPMLVAAIAASLGAWRDDRSDRRAMLALIAGILWIGVALAQFQIRTVYITSALFPLAAGWCLDRLFACVGETRSMALRIGAVVCGVMLFGLAWAAGFAIAEPSKRALGKPAALPVACHDPQNIAPLSGLSPGLVLAQTDLGPNILLHTRHSIVVAGYHRAVAGIVAGIEAFSGSEADMRRQADKLHVDYVVVCPSLLAGAGAGARPFAAELAAGRSVDWLEPVAVSTGPLKVWRVVRRP